MRGDTIYQVFCLRKHRGKDLFYGAFSTAQAAEAEAQKLKARVINGESWAQKYPDDGFEVRTKIVDTDFEIPTLPKPRDKYFVKTSPKANRPGTWNSTLVEVFRRGNVSDENQRICEYERNYAMLQTFEPFRQRGRDFALISREYTRTAVLDLTTGQVIAEEEKVGTGGSGFCPIGFYVPDWWDVHGSIIPGSEAWTTDHEWPTGDFGFVWGCIWGDDSSWKVQHLDLSQIQQGKILRDERFGYVELAITGYTSPCLSEQPPAAKSVPPRFIQLERDEGETKVTFEIEMAFDLRTGKSAEWERKKIANFE